MDDIDYKGKNSSDLDYLYGQVNDISDLYFLSLIIVNKLENSDKQKTLAELTYLLDNKSFLNLLWYFEGMTIRIPTRDELKDSLHLISLYYYHSILEIPWREALMKLGVDYNRNISRVYQRKYEKFLNEIKDIRLPSKLKEDS